jgi:hypothetical protein
MWAATNPALLQVNSWDILLTFSSVNNVSMVLFFFANFQLTYLAIGQRIGSQTSYPTIIRDSSCNRWTMTKGRTTLMPIMCQ